MATVASAITYARQKAQTDSNGLSDTNGLAWANNGLLVATRDLIAKDINAAKLIESYATISSSDTPPGKFAWPTDLYALKTIEVDFTDTGGQNYLQADKIDVANLQGNTSVDFIRLNQPTTSPLFTNWGNSGEVFPTVTTSALVRIIYFQQPTEYTATSDNINYPLSLDYRLIGDKILAAYFESLERFDVASNWEGAYQKKLLDMVNILGKQSSQPIKPEKLHITGWEF